MKFSVSLALTILILFFTPSAVHAQFADVSSSNSAYKEIEFLAKQNIISGYKETIQTFKPLQTVTRGQAIKMLVLASNKPLEKNPVSPFSDVSSKELTQYVASAVKHNILTVPSNKLLKPNEPINRSEMSLLLIRTFNYPVQNIDIWAIPFTDITSKDAAYASIRTLYYNGITKGTAANTFSPQQSVTRAQFSAFVARSVNQQFRLPLPSRFVALSNEKELRKAYVKTDGLNVRSTPYSDNDTNIIGKLNTNDIVSVYSQPDKDGWVKILYNGQLAYVANYFLQSSIVTTTSTQTLSKPIVSGSLLARATIGQPVYKNRTLSGDSIATIKEGDILSVLSISGFEVKVKHTKGEGYVNKKYVTLLNQGKHALIDRIIVLDPGHGGKDPGAVSYNTDGSLAKEKDVVLRVSHLVRQKLESVGAKVYMTRNDDTFVELSQRVAFAEKQYAELFISIHVNAATDSNANGAETFYSKTNRTQNEKADVKLATLINNAIVQQANMRNRGVKREDFHVIGGLSMPAILLELGFISNLSDRLKLQDEAYLQLYAEAIYQGIVQYYK